MENEIWIDVLGYDGIYEVSNLGNVKSLNYNHTGKAKFLSLCKDSVGYLTVRLYINAKGKTYKVHKLVAQAFLNHTPCGYNIVVNHKDFNKLNNRVDNLEVVTQRENSNLKHLKSKSNYVGVTWQESCKRWQARITINTKRIYLGVFKNEYDAHMAYQNKLKEVHHANI